MQAMAERTSPSRVAAQNGAPVADEQNVLNLTELGLTLAQSRVYLALLDTPEEKAVAVATRARVSRTKIYEVLQTLESYGFVASEGEHGVRYRPIPPDVAIPQWLKGRERHRRRERQRDEELGQVLADELPALQAEVEMPSDEFETIVGDSRVSAIFPGMGRRAAKTLCIMQMPPFVQPRRQWNLVEAEARSRGVVVRILQDESGFKEPTRIREALELGAEMRLGRSLPVKLIVRDDQEVAMSLRDAASGGRTGPTGVIIRERAVVAALQAVFEREWVRARRVTLDANRNLTLDDA
jgi:sugar-specific transcriptional regulator TrmB